jgi:hypothetical protein
MIDQDLARTRSGRGASVTLLVKPRPRRHSAYVVYGDALDAPEVHIHVRVIEDIRRATLDGIPHETVGVLLGRPCRDDFGDYVIVENVLTAALGEQDGPPGAVRISAGGRTSLHRRGAERHPTLEPVGWWHSQPREMPRLNSLELDEYASNSRPHDVRILAAADLLHDPLSRPQMDPLGVYVGASATRLARRKPER